MKRDGYMSIYEIPILKDCPQAQVLEVAESMAERGLIRWIDKKKGMVEITGLGCAVQEVRQGDRNN